MSLIARFHLGSFFGNTFFCCNIIFVFEAVGCPAFFYGYFSHWQSYNLSFPFNNLYISYISCIIILIYHYSFFMLLWTKCRSTENSKFHMKKKTKSTTKSNYMFNQYKKLMPSTTVCKVSMFCTRMCCILMITETRECSYCTEFI